jgi:hypothetical protein
MNDHLQDIANEYYGTPVCYLSVRDERIVKVLIGAGYCEVRDGHVREPLYAEEIG